MTILRGRVDFVLNALDQRGLMGWLPFRMADGRRLLSNRYKNSYLVRRVLCEINFTKMLSTNQFDTPQLPLLVPNASVDRICALFAGGKKAACRAGIVYCRDLALVHHDVDVAKPARTDGGATEAPIAGISDGGPVSGIVGPDLCHSLDRFIYGWAHTGENLLFGHSDHLNSGILCFLSALDCAAGQQHRGTKRHDNDNAHFAELPQTSRIQAQPEVEGKRGRSTTLAVRGCRHGISGTGPFSPSCSPRSSTGRNRRKARSATRFFSRYCGSSVNAGAIPSRSIPGEVSQLVERRTAAVGVNSAFRPRASKLGSRATSSTPK